MVAAAGLSPDVYPALKICGGTECEEATRIVEQLTAFLGCIPGSSVPKGANESYVNRLKPLK